MCSATLFCNPSNPRWHMVLNIIKKINFGIDTIIEAKLGLSAGWEPYAGCHHVVPPGRAVILKRTVGRAATRRSPHWRPIFWKQWNIQILVVSNFRFFFRITARPGGVVESRVLKIICDCAICSLRNKAHSLWDASSLVLFICKQRFLFHTTTSNCSFQWNGGFSNPIPARLLVYSLHILVARTPTRSREKDHSAYEKNSCQQLWEKQRTLIFKMIVLFFSR